ncbi:EAL domain-containing protein [Alteromonas pelagimontana]|uniref:EAL domain-containing protein n=1 Tax=Alteromonas pelagimontana TaxID=1858656 RepID=A0A6M4MBU6_9ALTE|nr:EAL domain-containing protein [Alteromonas pelagimontana]QJR80682.1 EAL domain-containing protein [Alteromonas pelagimontana]
MAEKIPQKGRNYCQGCNEGLQLDFEFTMAFQPIVNVKTATVFGYEALVRGTNEESAFSIISQVNAANLYTFDQRCRMKAIVMAAELNIDCLLSINFMPNAVFTPQRCIRNTLETAKTHDFPTEKIMFEFTESERIQNSAHINQIIQCYSELGFTTAIDDFGAGYSGLGLLANLQTQIVKIDIALIRNIHRDFPRQAILTHMLRLFDDLNITPVAEGVETAEELEWLVNAGISLIQGFYIAKPGFQHLPEVDFNRLTS